MRDCLTEFKPNNFNFHLHNGANMFISIRTSMAVFLMFSFFLISGCTSEADKIKQREFERESKKLTEMSEKIKKLYETGFNPEPLDQSLLTLKNPSSLKEADEFLTTGKQAVLDKIIGEFKEGETIHGLLSLDLFHDYLKASNASPERFKTLCHKSQEIAEYEKSKNSEKVVPPAIDSVIQSVCYPTNV